MRIAAAALVIAAIAAPTAAFAQDVIVREPADTRVIVREPAERRVIVREEPAEERVIVRRAPDVVRRYVIEESRPSIAYERRVVVADTLPREVETYSVPQSDMNYVVLNERRYIVDGDRRVVDVVD